MANTQWISQYGQQIAVDREAGSNTSIQAAGRRWLDAVGPDVFKFLADFVAEPVDLIAGEEFDADATRLVGAPQAHAGREGSIARTEGGSQGGSQWQSPQTQHASEVELEFWRSIKDSADHEEFQLYLERFSNGTYADLARRKMARLQASGTLDGTQTAADASAAKISSSAPSGRLALHVRPANAPIAPARVPARIASTVGPGASASGRSS